MAHCYVSDMIKVAKAEKGYHEKKSNKDLQSKTANSGSNNYNKYADHFDKKHPNFYNGKKNIGKQGEWCDITFDYYILMACGDDEKKARAVLYQPEKSCGAGCSYSWGYYGEKHRGKTPKLGAQVFFRSSATAKKPCHTGAVIAINGDYITVSEGNKHNEVEENKYNWKTNKLILGYGYPNYDEEPKKEATPTTTPVETKPAENKENSTASKTPVYELYKTYTLQVELNVRTGAGTNYPKVGYSKLPTRYRIYDKDKDGALDKGAKIVCQNFKKVGKDIWLKTECGWLAAYYSGKTYIK